MATKARRKFTAEFKREAVKLAEKSGTTVSAAARDLGGARSRRRTFGAEALDREFRGRAL